VTKPSEVTDALDEAADQGGDEVSADEIAGHLDQRGIGALLMLPGAIELTPIGGIPGVPTVLAAIAALFAAQVLIGREDLWLPGILGKRAVTAERLRKASDWLRPLANWADRHLGRHFDFMTRSAGVRLAAGAIIALCLTVPALELVPFASSAPMSTASLFGLALLTRDGRVMALAWAATIAAVIAIVMLWP
jgi:hypothetical protein